MTKLTKVLRIIIGVLLILAALVPVVLAAGDNFTYAVSVTVDSSQVPSTLTDYPLMVNGTLSELATTANGGYIENTVNTGGATGDLTTPADFDVGTDENCNTVIPYEWEDWDATTGEFTLHTKISSLSSSSDTVLYLCFGNSGVITSAENVTGVWDSSYKMVQHLNKSSGAPAHFRDSTTNNFDLEITGATAGVSGAVGLAAEFDGVDDHARKGSVVVSSLPMTVTAWVNQDVAANGDILSIANSGVEQDYYQMRLNLAAPEVRQRNGASGPALSTTTLTAGNWNRVTGVYGSNSSRSVYLNASVEDTNTDSILTPDGLNVTALGVLYRLSKAGYFDGVIDEVRISNIVRSDDWLLTSYRNQSDPASFLTVGTVYEVSGTPAVVMADHTVTISAAEETAVETAIDNYRPDVAAALDPLANLWAVTHIQDTDDPTYQIGSIVGLYVDTPTAGMDEWDLSLAVWTGVFMIRDDGGGSYTAAVEGSVSYDNMLSAAGMDDPSYQTSGGSGSPYYIFPWVAGRTAYYGHKGIHTDVGPPGTGYGGEGWKAIDWVGGTQGYSTSVYPNGVYVAQSGKVSYVCRDSVQTWVQIGNFLYGHLVDNTGLRYGVYHTQTDYLGALVTGSHLTPNASAFCEGPVDAQCGYMCQQPTSYHLHLGFKPNGDYFQVEDWVLSIDTGLWYNGVSSVGPGEYMTAEWGSGGPVPTPGPTPTPGGPTPTPNTQPIEVAGGGGHIWDSILGGVKTAAAARLAEVDEVQAYNEHEIKTTFVSGLRVGIKTVYVLLRSNLDLRVTMAVLGLLLILEPVRILRAVWVGIKELIPFIG